jgi:hypothetical protein
MHAEKKNPGAANAARGARSSASAHHIERSAGAQVYLIRVRSTRSGDSIRTLRLALKGMLRRLGLRALSVEEEPQP